MPRLLLIAQTRLLIAGVSALAAFGSCGGVAVAAGPAADVTVALSPASIPAGGSSTSTVVATVLDAGGTPVAGVTVQMFAPDRGIAFTPNPAHDNGDGTYTTTLTSSLVAESTPVLAYVGGSAPLVSSPAFLTQTAATTTSLAAVTNGPVTSANPPQTDQGVTLIATVTTSPSNVAPSGTVAFQNGGTPIAGCAAVPTPTPPSPSATVTCGTSFAAATSPAELTAVFTPGPGSLVAGSTSPAQSLPISRAPSSTSVSMLGAKASIGTAVSFLAVVTPSQSGTPTPTGSVQFADDGTPISACGNQPLGTYLTAACTITYTRPGAHDITASYSGDPSFAGSISGPATIAVQALGVISATMQWAFYHAPTYTQVLALIVNGAPPRATVLLKCHGHGCPFATRAIAIGKTPPCRSRRRARRCGLPATINLAHRFGRRRLRVGAVINVEIIKPRWVGKDYRFTVRAGRGPGVRIATTGG